VQRKMEEKRKEIKARKMHVGSKADEMTERPNESKTENKNGGVKDENRCQERRTAKETKT